MTISAFIFKYTLVEICDGNKSDLARRLGVEFKDIYRYEKQFDAGGGTVIGMEALIKMYAREQRSLDSVIKLYDTGIALEQAITCPNVNALTEARNAFAQGIVPVEAGRRYQKMADTFLDTQERLFCGSKRKPGACREFEQWVAQEQPADMDWSGCPCMFTLKTVKEAADQLKKQ